MYTGTCNTDKKIDEIICYKRGILKDVLSLTEFGFCFGESMVGNYFDGVTNRRKKIVFSDWPIFLIGQLYTDNVHNVIFFLQSATEL